ncbi:MAG: tripartite tricarboxylate transporter TctB family protein [candidate division NC10 bacterium]
MGERAAALAFLALGGLYLAGALRFPLGSAARPGSGFFPVGVGMFLCLVAGAFVAAAFRRRVAAGPGLVPPMSGDAVGRVAATTAGLLGFCFLLPWIGYPAAAFLFVALLLRRLGGAGWPRALVAAALAASASWYLFAVLLAVPLPRGILLDY